MIQESKKFGLKTVLVLFDDEKAHEVVGRGGYHRIIISTYKAMELPQYHLRKKTTALIDLTLSLEEIFKKFSDTTRNEIHKTERNSELRFEFAHQVDDEVYSLYRDFEHLQQRVPVSKKKLNDCVAFKAYYRDQLISALLVIKFAGFLRLRSIFSLRLREHDQEMYKVISNASRRLMWEVCQWGKSEGYTFLDLASVNFNNPKTANITKFKMSFGGNVVDEYTYTYTSGVYRMIEKLMFIKKIFSRLRHSR
jgi:hypothetical protein